MSLHKKVYVHVNTYTHIHICIYVYIYLFNVRLYLSSPFDFETQFWNLHPEAAKTQFPFCGYRETAQREPPASSGPGQGICHPQVLSRWDLSVLFALCSDAEDRPGMEPSHLPGSPRHGELHGHWSSRSPCCQSIPIFNRYMTCQIQYEPHGYN